MGLGSPEIKLSQVPKYCRPKSENNQNHQNAAKISYFEVNAHPKNCQSAASLRFIDATSCAETNGTIFDLIREVLHAGAKH